MRTVVLPLGRSLVFRGRGTKGNRTYVYDAFRADGEPPPEPPGFEPALPGGGAGVSLLREGAARNLECFR
ncbi:hypothetical protein GCM10017771_35670 [Streptomyces capitiformicae]|uniref:Uncharacterized protein n=1 Tax=Streptomyces capitiformicae TaxID=2014920 RepID=A0A919L8N2_9ACTN|nr:hypothetical protein GCM10017771_35670 [Streptomyces capitiformicae]